MRLCLYVRTALAALIVLVLLGDFDGARAEDAPAVAARERIIAVIPPDAPPTYFRDNVTGRPSGFSVETLDAIAERAGMRVEYRFVSGWDHVINAVEKGEADVVPDLGISEERK
ncbi:MAG TPA: transporter substrate-binding domain-containing protein, partial [Nitrospirota bacterium]